MLFNIQTLVSKYHMQLTGVLHVGAHLGEEARDYYDLHVPVWWVEANPNVIDKLCANVDPYPGQFVIPALITDSESDDPTPFNVTNYDGLSSSVFPFGTHPQDSPETVFVETKQLPSRTLDWVKRNWSVYANMLNLDIQGAELLALKGATELLPQIEYLYTEVSTGPVYLGGAQMDELDAFLTEFDRVETDLGMHRGTHGDALYIRKDVKR